MSDRPNKEQMMKIVVPALAISVILVLVGLLIGLQGDKDDPKKPKAKATGTGNSQPAITGDDSGMVDSVPPAESPEWKVLEGKKGLKIWDVKDGDGEPCRHGATVTIHYAGWLLNGTMFDSSRSKLKPGPGNPATFPLGSLIAGWQEGIPGMKPGGIRRLYIPFELGYGENGDRSIPPRADLIFEIKLLGSD